MQKGEMLSGFGAEISTEPRSRRRLIITLTFFLIGLLIYVGLASTNMDGNDIIELRAIKEGTLEGLFNPNHLLSRPLMYLLYNLLGPVFQHDTPIWIVQLFTGVSAAVGLGLFFAWASKLIRSESVAIITTFAFGTSWAYWVYGISTIYFLPAVVFVLVSLLALQAIMNQDQHENNPLAYRPLIFMALATALAVLFWQANIFLVPALLIGLYLKYRAHIRQFLTASVIYAGTSGVIVLAVYIFASYSVLKEGWGIASFIEWVINYGNASLASWGVLDITRVKDVPQTLVATILPVWEGFGLRDLLNGDFQSVHWLRIISIPALFFVVAIPSGILLVNRQLKAAQRNMIALLLLGVAIYLPFIVYWDPTEPIWFIIPTIGVWTAIGILWEALSHKWLWGVYAVLIFLIAQANFSGAIWWRHADPNPYMETAQCIHENMNPEDTYVSFEYHVADYLYFFFDQETLSMIDLAARLGDPEAALTSLDDSRRDISAQGGKIYFKWVGNLDNTDWLEDEVGLSPEYLERLQGSFAMTCSGDDFHVLESIAAP